MARITVEDCIDKVEGPYDLVLIAKERAVQLNSGEHPKVDPENDKNTVIALKEIAEDKISAKELQESSINKLRQHIEEEAGDSDQDEAEGDDFENIYKGEISKSGTPILPSKRARKIPEKIEIFKQDKEKVQEDMPKELSISDDDNVSLDELQEEEKKEERSNEFDNPETPNND